MKKHLTSTKLKKLQDEANKDMLIAISDEIDKAICNIFCKELVRVETRVCTNCNGKGEKYLHSSFCTMFEEPCSCPHCGIGECRSCSGTGKKTIRTWIKK